MYSPLYRAPVPVKKTLLGCQDLCVDGNPVKVSPWQDSQLEAFFQDTRGFFQSAVAFSETVQFDPLHQRPVEIATDS